MFDHSQKDKSLYIQKKYPITNEEFEILEERYGKLCWFAASKLASSNGRSEEDLQDFHSEILIGMFRAGSYYKRQTFIDNVLNYLDKCKIYMTSTDISILNELKNIWKCKAGFNETHETIIRDILKKYENAIEEESPKENLSLQFDNKFQIYCKAIIWNTTKSLGQTISKENQHKFKEMSLDEWEFLEYTGISDQQNFYIQDDFKSIKNQLSNLEDKRPLTTFNILSDPDNYNLVFKQKKEKENIKINVVRKKTNMSYRTIHKQLNIIKKIIQKEIMI